MLSKDIKKGEIKVKKIGMIVAVEIETAGIVLTCNKNKIPCSLMKFQ